MSDSSSSTDLRNRILFTIGLLAVYRFGHSNFIHELKAPRESQDRDLVEKIVEYDIKRFQEIELNVTNYWTKKGVSFNE